MECITKKLIWPHRSVEWCDLNEETPVLVPCGKCPSCLTNKRSEWIFRLQQEWKHSTSAKFITLTYDEQHNPGELRKEDLQKFMKRLRKHEKSKGIRYYACGEYGTKYGRPHYHIILFNSALYNHSYITRAWCDIKGNPIGIVHVGKVSLASIAYVTKYVVQPGTMEGRSKPFALMSRKYGIGGKYLTDAMMAWHREDLRNYAISDGQKVRLPRFYKDKIFYGRHKLLNDQKTKAYVIEQARKEQEYWETEFGSQWAEQKKLAVLQQQSLVKSKVEFSQTF